MQLACQPRGILKKIKLVTPDDTENHAYGEQKPLKGTRYDLACRMKATVLSWVPIFVKIS